MRIEELYQKVKKTIDMSILLAAYMATQSCIMDERYNSENLKNVDLTMNLFSKGVEFPLGSTPQLSFSDLSEISGTDFSMLTETADGSYSISFGDEIDLSDNLSLIDMGSLSTLDAISFAENFVYHVGIDKNTLGIQSQTWDENAEIGFSGFTMPSVSPVNRIETIQIGLYDEKLVKSLSLSDELSDIHVKNGITAPSVASLGNNGPSVKGLSYFVGDIPPVQIETVTNRIFVNHELEGIKSISDIELSGNAKMIVSLSVTNNYLVSGNIVPNIDVDLTKICGIEGYSGKMVNISDLVMNEDNGYRAVRTYDITGLVKNSFKDGRIYLDENVTIAGQIEGYSLTADRSLVADSYSKGGMMLNLDVQFENIDIESADVVLEPVTVATDDIVVPMNISPVALPSLVERISSVSLDRNKKTVLALDASDLAKINGLSVNLDEVVVEFPAGMHVEGASDGKLTIKGAKLPLRKEIVISSIDFPAPVAGYQSFNGNIKVKAKTTLSGTMNVADLPSCESDDPMVIASVSSSPVISDFSIKTNEFRHDLGMEQKFALDIDGIGDLGNITVMPEGKPNIEILFNTPSVQALSFRTGNEGITIALPSSIRLDESRLSSGYTYSPVNHSITICGAIPSKISLPVKEFHVSVSASEQVVKVSGELVAAAGVIGKSDVEALSRSNIGLRMIVPEMTAKSVRLDDGLSVRVDETASMTLVSEESIPEMVDMLSELTLDDVYINCTIDFDGLPGKGDYSVDLVATLPDCFSPSEIVLKGAVRNGRFVAQPIRLDAIRNLDMSKASSLDADIYVRGSLSAESADIDLESLKDDISVNMRVEIADKNGKISVDGIRARMHHEMSYSTTLSFEDIPEFLRSNDVCLDIKNPSLKLAICSNMGVPVNGEIELVPWRNGRPDGSVTVVRGLAFPYSQDSSSSETVELNLDPEQIARVFRHVPDSLEIVFNGTIDAEKDCVVDMGSDYFMDMTYDFDMPLAPGEDFMLMLSDTIDVSSELAEVISKTPVGLRIAARNSMPFGLKIYVDFLDADGNVLYLCDGDIAAGIAGGSRQNPCSDTIDVMIRTVPGSPVKDLSQLRISFALSGGTDTHKLMKDDYIEAEIKAVLPEGISFKIN